MTIEGIIRSIGQTESFGSNGFTKRELLVTTTDQYPQTFQIEFVKDKTSLLDAVSEGQTVKVSINLRSKEWTSPQGETKFFTTIQGWKIE